MPLSNTTQLISDIQTIMDSPPAGGSEAIAEAWAYAIANWLNTIVAPPSEALTADLIAAPMIPILSVDFTQGGTLNPPPGSPDFIDLLNLALVVGGGIILVDPTVAPLVIAGTVVLPLNTVTFNAAKLAGMAGGDSNTVASAMAADLLTWSLSGISPAGTWL
jgi:hypothetical protein